MSIDSSQVSNGEGAGPLRKGRIGPLFWIINLSLAVVILFAVFNNPMEYFALNNLYYAGQQGKWDDVYNRLQKLPVSYQANPQYTAIKLETLLHLARNSEAYAFVQAEKKQMQDGNRQAVKFQQLAAFSYILNGRDKEAISIFQRHAKSRLSKEMASLLKDGLDDKPIAVSRQKFLINLADKSMTFPGLYVSVIQYLTAQNYIRQGDFAKAIDLLEQASQRFPYEYVYRRELGLAYLQAGRFDLAAIQLLVAQLQLNDPIRYYLSKGDKDAFEQGILEKAMRYTATRVPSDFWRMLRSMEGIVSPAALQKKIMLTPHRRSLAEIWEWCQVNEGFFANEKTSAPLSFLLPNETAKYNALRQITSAPSKSPHLLIFSLPTPGSTEPGGSMILNVVPVSDRMAGLVRNNESATYEAPPPSESVDEGVLLCQIRGSLQHGIPGGCEVQIGMDKYWIRPRENAQWYAFPLPPLIANPVHVQFRFNSDMVAGYTEKSDKGDRNLYIQRIVACYARRK